MRTMKGLVAYAPLDYRYEDVEVPELASGEIIIRIKGCGICAGDLKAYHGGSIRSWGTAPGKGILEAPITPGHEFCGVVCEKASDVLDFELGDMIVAEQIVPCGCCRSCRQDEYWMCSKLQVFGLKQASRGGFAEYVILPAKSIKHKVPKEFSVKQAVLIEPYACGMHAVEQARIKHSDVVAIAGLGTIGLAITNIVRLYLPKMIIGIEVREPRLKLGGEFGADKLLNPSKCNVAEEIGKLTDGFGCDVYIEASGYSMSLQQGLDSLCNHGRYVQFGAFKEDVVANWNLIGDGKELTVRGSHLSARCYSSVIRGMKEGLLITESLITHTFPLKDWKTAFETLEKNPDVMKVMLIP